MTVLAAAAKSGEQSAMVWLAVLGGMGALALGFHALDRWYAKRNGGRTPAIVTRAGAAMSELQSLLEPSKRHVLEVRRQKKKDDGAGDDPEVNLPPAGSRLRS